MNNGGERKETTDQYLTLSKRYITRFIEHNHHGFTEVRCYKCNKPLSEGERVYRSKTFYYCIPCSKLLYYDSAIEITEEELEEFFA